MAADGDFAWEADLSRSQPINATIAADTITIRTPRLTDVSIHFAADTTGPHAEAYDNRMPSAAANIPSETDLLCEYCGYVLNGLPDSANCPECGRAAADSSPALRGKPAWEQHRSLLGFCKSTYEVLFHPTRFFRSLGTRLERTQSRWFGFIHIVIVSLLMGATLCVHAESFVYLPQGSVLHVILDTRIFSFLLFVVATYLTLELATRVAARLTNWESRYRGLRLPLTVVLRGLDYHAAHYLPVVVMAAVTVLGYRALINHHWIDSRYDATYLYVLCGEGVVGPLYLFWTYWIGMRNMMYANA